MILRQLRIRFEWRESEEPFTEAWGRLPSFARPEWRPPCDVYESGSSWVVKAELAGVDEEDLEVSLYEDGLLIEGSRAWRCPGERDELRVHAAEIRHGPFRVAVRLPPTLDRARATVGYDRGLVVIQIPKRGAA